MPPRPRKSASGEEYLNWTADEVLLLLNIAIEYKTHNMSQGKDWESMQSNYVDIAERMKQYLRHCGEADSIGKDYPHSPDDLSKEKVSSKLKAVRTKYRNAVDSGRKSGHGRVISLYFEECAQLWGGSPATSKIDSGLESCDIQEDTTEIASEIATTSDTSAKYSSDAEDSSCSSMPGFFKETAAGPNDSNEPIGKRRAELDSLLKTHKKRRIEKKGSAETQLLALAEEDIELKKEMMKWQRQLDEEYKTTLASLTRVMESLGQSINDGFTSL